MDSSTKYNPLYDPKTDNQAIDPAVQAMINKPLANPQGFSAEDQAFLDKLMNLIKEGKINLYSASSLLNTAVYESLDIAGKAAADKHAIVMLPKIREINDLMQVTKESTYQVENLVASLRLNKEEVEKISGDIFLI